MFPVLLAVLGTFTIAVAVVVPIAIVAYSTSTVAMVDAPYVSRLPSIMLSHFIVMTGCVAFVSNTALIFLDDTKAES